VLHPRSFQPITPAGLIRALVRGLVVQQSVVFQILRLLKRMLAFEQLRAAEDNQRDREQPFER